MQSLQIYLPMFICPPDVLGLAFMDLIVLVLDDFTSISLSSSLTISVIKLNGDSEKINTLLLNINKTSKS